MSKPINPIVGGPALAAGEALPSPGTPGSPAPGYPTGNIAPTDGNFYLNSADTRFPNGVVFPGVLIPGGAPPDTRFGWLDTSGAVAIPKYYDGAAWVSWNGAQGDAASDWSPLTATFTAGTVGTGGLLVDVETRDWFPTFSFVLLSDDTGVSAIYYVTAWSSDPLHPQGVVMTRLDAGLSPADSAYVFDPANGAKLAITGAPGAGVAGSGRGHWGDLVFNGNYVTFGGNKILAWVE